MKQCLVEFAQHMALGVLVIRRQPVARPLKIDVDDLRNASRRWLHHHDPVGEQQGFVDVVGDEQQCRPGIGPQVEQVRLQVEARKGIECRERFVQQQHAGPGHERTGDGPALALTAG